MKRNEIDWLDTVLKFIFEADELTLLLLPILAVIATVVLLAGAIWQAARWLRSSWAGSEASA